MSPLESCREWFWIQSYLTFLNKTTLTDHMNTRRIDFIKMNILLIKCNGFCLETANVGLTGLYCTRCDF